ncbi:MAG: rhamnan synthesis F family protein, partial [Oscillospiraceae bacterium]
MINKTKRLAIYFFYDKQGIADEYNFYLLNDLKKNIDELLVVINGKIEEKSLLKFKNVANKVIVRENIGFDVWAYKEGMESYGEDGLNNFDEIILLNFTNFGPLYPFSEMFSEMEKRDDDFWGITVFHEVDHDPFNTIKYNYIPLHIQSHFIAVRKNLFNSKDFKIYWENMPQINSYEDSIGNHEAIFTKHFCDKGYKWSSYIDTTEFYDDVNYPLMYKSKYLIEEKRCPILKRRTFFHEYIDIIQISSGENVVESFNYIKNNLDYDTDMILENLIRVQNQHDLVKSLKLIHVLPSDISKLKNKRPFENVALVMHIYFEDLINYCYKYAQSMPSYSDIYITTHSEKMKTKITEVFSNSKFSNVKVLIIENRGRDVSSLLVGVKDVIMNYDIVCFCHDKKTKQITPSTVGESFSYRCFENTLKSEDYVENILNLFYENKKLGMLCPT